jgi:hypothetical protein
MCDETEKDQEPEEEEKEETQPRPGYVCPKCGDYVPEGWIHGCW